MEKIIQLDHELFARINGAWTTPALDAAMVFITTFRSMLPVLALFLAFAAWRFRLRALKALFLSLVAVAASDIIAAQALKPLIGRDRPSFALGEVRLLVPKQSSPSFPSNHAANTAAMATVAGLCLPELRALFWAIAILTAYSRVYVGVHFPLDVLGGMALGAAMGLLFYRLGPKAAGLLHGRGPRS